MAKVRTTVTLDAEVMRLVKVRAAREGKGDSEVIEESLRRDLGLALLEPDRVKRRSYLHVVVEVHVDIAIPALRRFFIGRMGGIRNLAAAGLNPVVTVTEASASASSEEGRAGLLRWMYLWKNSQQFRP